jgi:hypothetical protein
MPTQTVFLPASEHEQDLLFGHVYLPPGPDLTPIRKCEVVAMTQQLHFTPFQTATTDIVPPVYQNDLTRTIGVLQQLQVLCATQGDVSLADLIQVVRDMQREFGDQSQLEHVIQSLVGRHLCQQLTVRHSVRQGNARTGTREAVEVMA